MDLVGAQRFGVMKVDLLYRQSTFAVAANVINGAIYVTANWSSFPPYLIISWYCAIIGLSLFRVWQSRQWRRYMQTVPVIEVDSEAWRRRFNISIFISGCLWGLTGVMIFPSTPPIQQVITIFILAGMSAGSLGSYSSYPSSTYLFFFPAIMPMAIHFLFMGDREYYAMSFMAVLYSLFMMRLARNVSDYANRSLELTIERAALLAEKNVHEAASREKSLFLAGVSHEIRTPLTAINGYTEMLLSQHEATESIRKELQIINRHGNHLVVLVNDLLDLARIESGEMLVEKRWMSPSREISNAVAVVKPIARKKGIALEMAIGANTPEQIFSDPHRFLQVVINLMNNAVKFTYEGRVQVSTHLEGNRLILRVSDSGVGIEPEFSKKLFEPFERGKMVNLRNEEGSGLGLALSLRIAKALGGDLRLVESRVGKGSTFELTVPSEPSADEQISIASQQTVAVRLREDSLRDRRILVAEDDLDLRDLTQWHLLNAGAKVTLCSNGQEAVELARQSYFDAILMDIQMPILNGCAAAKKLRAEGIQTPIIALTAHASQEDQRKCIECGCTGYVSKPFSAEILLQTIAQQIADGGSGPRSRITLQR